MLIKCLLYICLISTSGIFAQDPVEAVTPVPATSVISGRVYYEDTGKPVRRASLTLVGRIRVGSEPSALTDSDGYFQIKDVPADTYFPVVNSPGVLSPTAFIDPLRTGDEGFEKGTRGFNPIVVNGTGSVEVNIPVKRGGAISGRVVYADGDPAIGIKIEVMKKTDDGFMPVIPNLSSVVTLYNGGAGVYETDDRGYFRSAGLPAGKYIVRITEKGKHSGGGEVGYSGYQSGGSLLAIYYPDVFELSLAQVVDIELGEDNPEIAIVIPDRELRKITGKVVSAKGKVPIRGARITLTRKVGENVAILSDPKRSDPTIFSDDKGEWGFEQLPKGTYEIKVEPNGGGYDDRENVYGFSMSNSNGYGGYTPKKGVEFARKIQEITLDGKDLAGLVIELSPGGSIMGKVVVDGKDFPAGMMIAFMDENGRSLASTLAWEHDLRDEDRTGKIITTDFRLGQIPAGKGSLRISVLDDQFYVKSARLRSEDLLAGPIDLKEGQAIRGVEIVLGTDVGTIKGKVLTDKNVPATKSALLLVPMDAVKRKHESYRKIVTMENGEFETRVAPGEYAVIFKDSLGTKKGDEMSKAIEEMIKNAVKIKIAAGSMQKITLNDGRGTQ